MQDEFARALLSPPQPIIIGVRMQPFSLGHRLLLEQIGSAFAALDRFPLFDDLIASAFICAHSWEENKRLRKSRFGRWMRLKIWGSLAGKFNIPLATIQFTQYAQDALRPPYDQQEHAGGMRELGAPESARLYLFLRGRGFSEAEAMDIPLTAAHWLYAAEMEIQGKIDLVGPTLCEAIRRAQGNLPDSDEEARIE